MKLTNINKKNKKASEMTVSRLVKIILVVVVLVLIIAGLVTKAFVPLKEKLGGMFDYVLILLQLKTGTQPESSEVTINVFGKDYQALINDGENRCKFLSIVKDADGKDLGIYGYNFKDKGGLEIWQSGKWVAVKKTVDSSIVGQDNLLKAAYELRNIKDNLKLYADLDNNGVNEEYNVKFDDWHGLTLNYGGKTFAFGRGFRTNHVKEDSILLWEYTHSSSSSENGEWYIFRSDNLPAGDFQEKLSIAFRETFRSFYKKGSNTVKLNGEDVVVYLTNTWQSETEFSYDKIYLYLNKKLTSSARVEDDVFVSVNASEFIFTETSAAEDNRDEWTPYDQQRIDIFQNDEQVKMLQKQEIIEKALLEKCR